MTDHQFTAVEEKKSVFTMGNLSTTLSIGEKYIKYHEHAVHAIHTYILLPNYDKGITASCIAVTFNSRTMVR